MNDSFTGAAQHQVSQSEQVSNFVDMSRFNISHEMPHHCHESSRHFNEPSEQSLTGALRDKSASKVKVVGINLAPIIKEGKKKAESKSSMDINDLARQERCKDLPISLKDMHKRKNRQVPGTSLGMTQQASSSGQNLNFFAKPSLQAQEEDLAANFRAQPAPASGLEGHGRSLQPERPESGSHVQVAGRSPMRPSSSTGVMLNASKLSGLENSQLSQNKIKFDLSKQIDQINKQKLAREKTLQKPAQAAKPDLKKARSQTSLKAAIKKPSLNIQIDDDYLEEEVDYMNKPVRIEGLGLDEDFTQQNVMESFRNYQHKKQLQAQGLHQPPVVEPQQQF